MRFALEPKPNEPRGDILLPTIGHAIALIAELEHPEMVGPQPRGRARGDGRAQLRARHRQALWHGKLFHVDLNGQHGPRFDQDLRFGAGNLRGAFWTVDALLGAGTANALRRLRPLRLQAAARRGDGRRLGVGARLHAQLPDPAREGAGVPGRPRGRRGPRRPPASPSSTQPTLAPGESLDDLRDGVVRPRGAARPQRRAWRPSTSSRWSTCSASAERHQPDHQEE